MPSPTTNPLNSAQKKYLRGLAMKLKPRVAIGKNGLTDSCLKELQASLDREELVKVKLPAKCEDKKVLASQVEKAAACHQVGLIGRMAVFYKSPANTKIRIINLS